MELNENIVAIETYLNSKPEILSTLRESRKVNVDRLESKEKMRDNHSSNDN